MATAETARAPLWPVERPGPQDDATLVQRVLHGDRGAFSALVRTYEPALFALCRRLLGGRDAEAEDVTQDTFLRAFSRLGELQDPHRFAPWLYSVARSLCREKWRREAAERRALEGRSELERIAALEAEDSRTDVGAVIAGLPEVERRALELKYFEGLSYQEIARCMGLSFSKVDHLIRQARARLGHRMGVRRRRHEGDL